MELKILTSKKDIYQGINLWNENNEGLKIREELVRQNLFAPFSGVNVNAFELKNKGKVIGFALVKYLDNPINKYVGTNQGWISLFTISSQVNKFQSKTEYLIKELEGFLKTREINKIRFGGDPQNFLAGLPFSLKEKYLPILENLAYQAGSVEYDLYRNITNFEYSRRVPQSENLEVRRVTVETAERLYKFLQKNFPGRWSYEAQNIGRLPGGINDYWLLWYQDQPAGFARSNTADSSYKGPNVNWGHNHGDLYCGLGPLGIARRFRKKGWGLYMITEIIKRLKNRGYEHMEIDWTTLVDYYKKLGFKSCRKYLTLNKKL